jgi:anti-anti-sigma regulatory factor
MSADGALRFIRTGRPAGLVIAGDIDEFSHDALVSALAELTEVSGDIHLDLAGVEYCDLAGLRSMVTLAASGAGRGGGTRVVLHAVPPQLRTALRIVGWEDAPGLVIDERRIGWLSRVSIRRR